MDGDEENPNLQRLPNSIFGMPALTPAAAGGGGGATSSDQPRNINLNAVDGGGGGAGLSVREQDRFMPIANVIRIMRKVLPSHAKISDDAKETIQECVSEYISFITSEANERCQREQRKTITAEDVLWAMSKLGFDDYVEPLSFYLNRYRETEGDHRGSLRGDPLLPLKRSHSEAGTSATAALYGDVPPPPQMHHGMYGDGVTGYYMNMYGDVPGAGSSSSSQGKPMGGGSDPYRSFK